MTHKEHVIEVERLSRVEGEGQLYLRLEEDAVADVELRIYEPPRFFEALLKGRSYLEPPDITARICGICPVAYQMSAAHAIEAICGVQVTGQLRALRRLIYCGEWLQSHALHVGLLHAPDFLGVDSALELASQDRSIVERSLELVKTGSDLMALIGGRAIHPINVRVGGFYSLPERRALEEFSDRLKRALDASVETVRWVAGFDFPDVRLNHDFLSLHHPGEYPLNEGRIVTSSGLDFPADEFESYVKEEHVARSHALHAHLKGAETYLVGAMARYNLCHEQLSPLARGLAAEVGLGTECRNPFQSIVVRAIEMVYACDEALRLIEEYEQPDEPAVEFEPRAGTGAACTEAPRGTLYHRYTIDDGGTILEAVIVPPTAQNQRAIEADIRQVATHFIDQPTEALGWECERAIRNHDPCISCAAHFLDVHVERV